MSHTRRRAGTMRVALIAALLLGVALGGGIKDETVYVLNFQPVIPIKLNREWNLITRTVVPVINQPSLFPGPNSIFGSAWGLGDINPSLFLSREARCDHLGRRADVHLPTATDWRLGSGKFSLGPTATRGRRSSR